MAGYALNISDDGRVLSATYVQFAAPGQPIVATLPEGDIGAYDYIYGVLVMNETRAAVLAAQKEDDT